MNKYKLNEAPNGFFEIEAIKTFTTMFGTVIEKGTKGGYVQGPHNLSQKGLCWIDANSMVINNARVEDDALILGVCHLTDDVVVRNKAFLNSLESILILKNNVIVSDESKIIGYVIVTGTTKFIGRTCVSSYIENEKPIVIDSNMTYDNVVVWNDNHDNLLKMVSNIDKDYMYDYWSIFFRNNAPYLVIDNNEFKTKIKSLNQKETSNTFKVIWDKMKEQIFHYRIENGIDEKKLIKINMEIEESYIRYQQYVENVIQTSKLTNNKPINKGAHIWGDCEFYGDVILDTDGSFGDCKIIGDVTIQDAGSYIYITNSAFINTKTKRRVVDNIIFANDIIMDFDKNLIFGWSNLITDTANDFSICPSKNGCLNVYFAGDSMGAKMFLNSSTEFIMSHFKILPDVKYLPMFKEIVKLVMR